MKEDIYKAIVISPRDNVATAINDIKAGENILVKAIEKSYSIIVKQNISFGHKFAIKKINEGEKVIKYGEAIGIATSDIEIGEHVHIHNIVSLRI